MTLTTREQKTESRVIVHPHHDITERVYGLATITSSVQVYAVLAPVVSCGLTTSVLMWLKLLQSVLVRRVDRVTRFLSILLHNYSAPTQLCAAKKESCTIASISHDYIGQT